MNWRDVRDSCTCSCTLTGLPAQIPTELRRGSANKTQTVILEVPTCLIPHILTMPPAPKTPPKKTRPPLKHPPLNPLFSNVTIILLLLHYYCYTTLLCCMFSPVLGVSRSNIIIIYYTHKIRTNIYVFLYYIVLYLSCELVFACVTCGHAHARHAHYIFIHLYTHTYIYTIAKYMYMYIFESLYTYINYVYKKKTTLGTLAILHFYRDLIPQSDNPQRLIFFSQVSFYILVEFSIIHFLLSFDRFNVAWSSHNFIYFFYFLFYFDFSYSVNQNFTLFFIYLQTLQPSPPRIHWNFQLIFVHCTYELTSNNIFKRHCMFYYLIINCNVVMSTLANEVLLKVWE